MIARRQTISDLVLFTAFGLLVLAGGACHSTGSHTGSGTRPQVISGEPHFRKLVENLNDGTSCKELIGLVHRKDAPPRHRKAACYWLGKAATQEAIQCLMAVLRDPRLEMREAAIVGLNLIPDKPLFVTDEPMMGELQGDPLAPAALVVLQSYSLRVRRKCVEHVKKLWASWWAKNHARFGPETRPKPSGASGIKPLTEQDIRGYLRKDPGIAESDAWGRTHSKKIGDIEVCSYRYDEQTGYIVERRTPYLTYWYTYTEDGLLLEMCELLNGHEVITLHFEEGILREIVDRDGRAIAFVSP